MLDKQPYAVLSDSSILQERESLPPHASEEVMEVQDDEIGNEDSNYANMYDDEGMFEPEYESSDNEQHVASVDVEDRDVSNILIGLRGSRVRFKVCVLKLFGGFMPCLKFRDT